MATQVILEKWPGKIHEVNIGTAKIGGETTLPFLFKEGAMPNKPRIAFEVWDIEPQDFPPALVKAFGKSLKDPFLWLDRCVKDFKAEMICVRLQGTHPDFGDKGAGEAAKFISEVIKKTSLPLIITGSGDDAKDNMVLPACSEAAKGKACLIGSAVQDNYKTLAAACLADGHSIIAESPIDINIAKQLNILISDMGLPLERIVVNPTIGALGYGLEYAYSIMERARLAGLSGDKTIASAFICFVGQEAWRAKEAKVEDEKQGIAWEMVTATALLQAGADLLVMRHPVAVEKVSNYIESLMR